MLTQPDEIQRYSVQAARLDLLFDACSRIGRAAGFEIRTPANMAGCIVDDYDAAIGEIARASRLQARTVSLRDHWWRGDSGHLLAFWGEERYPAALLMQSPGRYMLYSPATDEMLPVDTQTATDLAPTAYTFYRALPGQSVTTTNFIGFAWRVIRRDVRMLLGVGLVGGLLNVLTPVITGIIFDQAIPAGDRSQLYALGALLIMSVVVAAFFNFIYGIIVLRIEGRVDDKVQTPLWGRLVNLPPSFFREYAAGDLAERATGMAQIRLILTNALGLSLISAVFVILNLLLLFYYDVSLALLATVIVSVSTGIILAGSYLQLQYRRRAAQLHGETSGIMLQLLAGIAKLRVAGAENRAYTLWHERFFQEREMIVTARAMQNKLNVFTSIYPVLASLILFAAVYNRTHLSTGQFLAFHAAFIQLVFSVLHLCGAIVEGFAAIPVYERLKPILHTPPEVDEDRHPAGNLTGAVEIQGAVFRYHPETSPILDNLSLKIHSGEFVALVGASGSGKTTLLRLLLGFEALVQGEIYYDGQALSMLDVQSVRRQIGVVLQNGRVMSGSILSNIIGQDKLTMEDAWHAAWLAGLDDEIRALPMGMHTHVDEEGSTFAGGQRQKLLIARALARKPGIILFDEATSSLDEQSQAVVMERLKTLNTTRIVVAHRLNTLAYADRILVLHQGKIVEEGTYSELMKMRGYFHALAGFQMG